MSPARHSPATRAARSVQQAHVRIDAIADGVVQLVGGRHRAVLEVSGVDFGLLTVQGQEALAAAFGAFLNGLGYPVQILVRVVPADLARYLGELERRARDELPEGLALLAHDHSSFLRQLAGRRALLERRFYVVVPAGEDDAGAATGRSFGLPFALPFTAASRRRAADSAAADAGHIAPAVHRQLTARCEELAQHLGRCGLAVRRLSDVALAQLFHAVWCPELSRTQRLRGQLGEYTALAVQRATPWPPPAAAALSPTTERKSPCPACASSPS